MNDVLVLRAADKMTAQRARAAGLETVVLPQGSAVSVPFERALIVEPGAGIPWDLVGYGLHFLQRWDAAAPLWRYGVLAQDLGTPAEQKRTVAITKDLRVPVYAHELLFVRASADGLALLRTFADEQERGDEPRLAFLRALHRVKPIFCSLPRSWLADAPTMAQEVAAAARREAPAPAGGLIRVKIGPGRFVRCRPGEEAMWQERYARMRRRG
jgi:hypothetical protein